MVTAQNVTEIRRYAEIKKKMFYIGEGRCVKAYEKYWNAFLNNTDPIPDLHPCTGRGSWKRNLGLR